MLKFDMHDFLTDPRRHNVAIGLAPLFALLEDIQATGEVRVTYAGTYADRLTDLGVQMVNACTQCVGVDPATLYADVFVPLRAALCAIQWQGYRASAQINLALAWQGLHRINNALVEPGVTRFGKQCRIVYELAKDDAALRRAGILDEYGNLSDAYKRGGDPVDVITWQPSAPRILRIYIRTLAKPETVYNGGSIVEVLAARHASEQWSDDMEITVSYEEANYPEHTWTRIGDILDLAEWLENMTEQTLAMIATGGITDAHIAPRMVGTSGVLPSASDGAERIWADLIPPTSPVDELAMQHSPDAGSPMQVLVEPVPSEAQPTDETTGTRQKDRKEW